MSDASDREILVVYGPPIIAPTLASAHCHIRITGERGYACDSGLKYPPTVAMLRAEAPSPLSKVCPECSRIVNELVEEDLGE